MTISAPTENQRTVEPMGDVVNITDYLHPCEHCVWRGKPGECTVPGGWRWDPKYRRCMDFKRKEVKS